MTKPLAMISLDLDNQWSYMKTHADPGWERFPSYFDIVIPRLLEFFARNGLRITVFVVGQDAELPKNHSALRLLAAAGHELANHSFNHEPWLHHHTAAQLDAEVQRAGGAIEQVAGCTPVGFRGPGHSLTPALLETLLRRGYLYDASTLPTFFMPLVRACFLASTKFSKDEREQRRLLGGSWREGFRRLTPYRWATSSGALLELPITTLPLLRLPLHATYLNAMATRSTRAAIAYFRFAVRMCRTSGVPFSLLLHATDFLGGDDGAALAYIPGMTSHTAKKLELMQRVIDIVMRAYRVQTLRQYAESLRTTSLPLVEPRLPGA
ncbi:MAG: polysaccharide deacetylase family protein [Planctomycetota bacterium]